MGTSTYFDAGPAPSVDQRIREQMPSSPPAPPAISSPIVGARRRCPPHPPGHVIEHIIEVKEDRRSRWELASLLWAGDVRLDAKLHYLDDRVHSPVHPDGVVERKHIGSKRLSVRDHDVAGGEATHAQRDGNRWVSHPHYWSKIEAKLLIVDRRQLAGKDIMHLHMSRLSLVSLVLTRI